MHIPGIVSTPGARQSGRSGKNDSWSRRRKCRDRRFRPDCFPPKPTVSPCWAPILSPAGCGLCRLPPSAHRPAKRRPIFEVLAIKPTWTAWRQNGLATPGGDSSQRPNRPRFRRCTCADPPGSKSGRIRAVFPFCHGQKSRHKRREPSWR